MITEEFHKVSDQLIEAFDAEEISYEEFNVLYEELLEQLEEGVC